MVIPAAIVIPDGAVATTLEPAPVHGRDRATPVSICRGVAAIFALILLVARLRPPSGLRMRALTEIVLALAVPLWLIVGGYFTGKPDAAQYIAMTASAIYTLSLGWPRDWHWNGSARAWWLAGSVVLIAVATGAIAHADDAPLRELDTAHVIRYFGWALLQQYLVCVVCTRRWLQLSGNAGVAVLLGAFGFALLHTPNANLMFATFVGGLCWCALYLRERALLPLAASHAASALALIALTPPQWLYSAEVSARFFQ